MYYAILRIFLLLFLPISVWLVYSWSFQIFQIATVELPKFDKVELLHLSLQASTPSVVKPIVISKKIVIEETIIPKIIDTNISTSNEANVTKNKSKEAGEADIRIVLIQNIPDPVSAPITADTEDNSTEKNDTKSQKVRIFLLGDSMGQGVAYGLGQIKRHYPIAFISIAKCSTTTHYWLAYSKLEEKISTYKPTVIWIVLGTNEWNGVGSSTKLRILKLHNRIDKLGIKTVWITPPVSKANKFCGMVHDVYGDMMYDSRFLTLPRGHDHIHPTPNGYVTWTKEILCAHNIKKIK